MAITSTFYDTQPGQRVTETKYAESARSRTSLYGVSSASDLLCTAHPSTPYTVNIGPALNGFWGHGVWDTSDAITLVTCTPPATGARRFDLITARRDWTPTAGGPTVITKVQGSSVRALPTGRLNKPGEVDDQPLWLVEWLGGQTQPQTVTDLRLIGGFEASDKLALKYMEIPGQPVRIAGNTWNYELVGNGQWEHRATRLGDSGWVNVGAFSNGFLPITTSGWSGVKFRVVNGWAMINGAVRRSTPWGDDAPLMTLSADVAPEFKIQGVGCQITAAGSVSFVYLPAGSNFTSFSATWPLRAP